MAQVTIQEGPRFLAEVVSPGEVHVVATGITFLGDGGGVVNWDGIEDKPATFPAQAHEHAIDEVNGLQDALNGKQVAGNYATANHTHEIEEVNGLQAALDGKQVSISSLSAVLESPFTLTTANAFYNILEISIEAGLYLISCFCTIENSSSTATITVRLVDNNEIILAQGKQTVQNINQRSGHVTLLLLKMFEATNSVKLSVSSNVSNSIAIATNNSCILSLVKLS